MSKKKSEFLGGRTVTVTCLGTMSNDEAMDILAEYIAKRIYKQRIEEEKKKYMEEKGYEKTSKKKRV